MADKDYKVQVGVEAKADTRGLDQVNKGLDKVRKTAHQVNEELGDKEVATNLEEVTDAAEETADALDKTSDAAEGVQEAVSQVGQEAKTTGNEMDKAGSKGEEAGRKMERGARRAASGLGNLKSKVQATFNIPTELEAAYNRGVAWGKAILDAWDKYIEGVDKAAVKRARELKDRLATEAATREQAYTDALTNAKRERIYDEEQRRITAINDLYTQRLQLIGQLAVNRTAEVDHVEALRQKELELQRTIVKTREIRGEISKETAAALMADLDASEAKSAAKSREDRQQIMLDAAIQARDETAKQVAQIKAEQEQAAKSPYAGVTPDGYRTLKRREEVLDKAHQEAKDLLPQKQKLEQEKQRLEKSISLLEKTQELNKQQRMNPLLGAENAIYETERRLQADRARLERINKELGTANIAIAKDKSQQAERQLVEDKIDAIEDYYRTSNPLKSYSANNDGAEKMKNDIAADIAAQEAKQKDIKDRLKEKENSSSWTRPTSLLSSRYCSTSVRSTPRRLPSPPPRRIRPAPWLPTSVGKRTSPNWPASARASRSAGASTTTSSLPARITRSVRLPGSSGC